VRRSLLTQVLLAMAAVALLSVGIAGLVTRTQADSAFESYLTKLPAGMGPGMGAGRRIMLGGAEQTFLATVDRGILIGALVALALAGVAAIALAYYLTRPLERLTEAAQTLAGGELGHRVDVGGPAEVARLGAAFNEMAASLDEAESLRSRMVADVAHELRTPIATLRAQVEGVAEGVLAPDPARLASLVEDTRHLSRLVSDLQELSVAEAGRLRYDMAPLDLVALSCRAAERAAGLAPAGVAVVCTATGDAVVLGDEGRLTQVLRNLLDNALRHTEAGRIDVAVTRGPESVRVAVQDTGEGIPPNDLPYIFERFYRADAARARDTGGTGIGLAISRRIVGDHGGTLFAENAEGGGAVVGFTIPLDEGARRPA
jgi:two-component system, OmpR family, sensor histidine kinase BaeS